MANQGDDSRDVNDVTWIQIPETHIMVKEGVRNEEGVRNVYYYATTTEDLMQVADATQTEAQIMEIINAALVRPPSSNADCVSIEANRTARELRGYEFHLGLHVAGHRIFVFLQN